MAKTIEQRLTSLEKTVMDFFTGGKRKTRKAPSSSASKSGRTTKSRSVKKSKRAEASRA